VENGIPRPRVVLVEDNEDNLEAVSIVLGEKFSVFGYTSAVEALAAIDAVQPDVAVLDIGMQPIDGVECLARIRSIPRYRDIPAIAMTGFARDVDRRAFQAGGFQAVLVKPMVDPDELIVTLDRLIPTRSALHLDYGQAVASSGVRGSGTERRSPGCPGREDAR
jgi:CheY-like chemotaxis protein